MKKKIIDYLQVTICVLLSFAVIIGGSDYLFGHFKQWIIKDVVNGTLMMLTTISIIIVIREVKYLKRVLNPSDVVLVVALISVVLVVVFGLVNDRFCNQKIIDWAIIGMMSIPFFAGLYHLRYGVIAMVTIAGTFHVALFFCRETISLDYYFMLGSLAVLVAVSQLIRVIFFYRWSKGTEKENKQI